MSVVGTSRLSRPRAESNSNLELGTWNESVDQSCLEHKMWRQLISLDAEIQKIYLT